MSASLILAFVWLVVANASAMLPAKRNHWRTAYALMTVGLPLLVWVYLQNGWFIALLALIAAASVLRWPVWYMWRWAKRMTGG